MKNTNSAINNTNANFASAVEGYFKSIQNPISSENLQHLKNVCTASRCLSMDSVLKAKSGHIGLPLGGAEIATYLYFYGMRHSAQNSKWSSRDRFVLSAGHGSMLQYSLLHLAGYKVSLQDIQNFRQWGSNTAGHPEYGHTEGVECTTGPLGQGISNAVGMAISEEMIRAHSKLAAQQNEDIFPHYVYTIVGDGCLMEGVASESCSLAGHLRLSNLVAFYDANRITIDGTIDISFTENVSLRFEAYGWQVVHADAHDFESLRVAHAKALFQNESDKKPTLIVCKGVPGKGSPDWEGKHKVHGNPMSAEDVVRAKKHLGIENTEPFFVPEFAYKSANKLLSSHALAPFGAFAVQELSNSAALPTFVKKADREFFETTYSSLAMKTSAKMATRVASGKALQAIANVESTLVGGSADLAGSNNTTLSNSSFIQRNEFAGRNIHFGVREHGMAAICNGIALHGTYVPYCATFAVFADYLRPTLRLAALMKIQSIFVLTHDSYAVGEDGPTHQPVEHAASLRCIPQLNVVRPADALETFAAWELAYTSKTAPTALLLTRQDLPALEEVMSSVSATGETSTKFQRTYEDVLEGVKKGGYIVKESAKSFCVSAKEDSETELRDVVMVSTGSEVAATLLAAIQLEKKTFKTISGKHVQLNIRVVSAPQVHMLAQNPLLHHKLVPLAAIAIGVEAGSSLGWGDVLGRTGFFHGMKGFGASAPAQKLTEEFGFDVNGIEKFVLNALQLRAGEVSL